MILSLTMLWLLLAPGSIVAKAELTYIGSATMAADGTITLHLTRTADGKFAEGVLTYKIGDPDYQDVLAHLGGMKPGETKPVPPWPGN
jgi:hypothetical protein